MATSSKNYPVRGIFLLFLSFALTACSGNSHSSVNAPEAFDVLKGLMPAPAVGSQQKEVWFADFLQTDSNSFRGGYVETYAYCPINRTDSWKCRSCLVFGATATNNCSAYPMAIMSDGKSPACPGLATSDSSSKIWGCFYGFADNSSNTGFSHMEGSPVSYFSKGYNPNNTLEVFMADDDFVYDLSERILSPSRGSFSAFGQSGASVKYPMRGQLWARNHQMLTFNSKFSDRFDATPLFANANFARPFQANRPYGLRTNFLSNFPAGSQNVVQASYYPGYNLYASQPGVATGLVKFGNLKDIPVDLYEIRDSVLLADRTTSFSELYTYGRSPDQRHHYGMVSYAVEVSVPEIVANAKFYPGASIDEASGLVQVLTKLYTQINPQDEVISPSQIAQNNANWWDAVFALKPLNDPKLRIRAISDPDNQALPNNRGGFSPIGEARDFSGGEIVNGGWLFAEHNLSDSDFYFESSGTNPVLNCNQGYTFRGSLMVRAGWSGLSRRVTPAGWMGLCVSSNDPNVYLGGATGDLGFDTRGWVLSGATSYVCDAAGACRFQPPNHYVNLYVRTSQCVGSCNAFH